MLALGGPRDGLPHRRPRPGPDVPGGGRRRPLDPRRLRRRRAPPFGWPTSAPSSRTSWSTSRRPSSTRRRGAPGPAGPRTRSRCTQDRLAERRFVERRASRSRRGARSRPTDDLRARPPSLGLPLRLKAATGGYDGRSQVRRRDAARARRRAGATGPAPPGRRCSPSASWPSSAELSVVVARGTGRPDRDLPVARNVHDDGILAESVAPAPIPPDVAERAAAIGERLAIAMGLVGTLTVELFLHAGRLARRQRARAAGPQQRPLDDRGRRDVASSSSTSGRSAGCALGSTGCAGADRRWSTCWARARRRAGALDRPRSRRSRTPTSTSTSTTSDGSSSAARWAT